MASDSAPARPFVLASRASELAQIQTNIVRAALAAAAPAVPLDTAFMATAGDKNQSQALYLLGGKSLWTKELEVALLDGSVDMLVHSLKDVPTALPAGCVLGAVLAREDPVDALVVRAGAPWRSLAELPAGSVVGTSSVRRVAQLRRQFPALVFQDVRGNLNTRLAKLDAPAGPFAALVLAKAGLVRLGRGARVTADLAPPTLLHAVGQGALGVEVRADDARAAALCAALAHAPTQWACAAERACLRVLEGGCSVPVGVASQLVDGVLELTACVTALDGSTHVQRTVSAPVAEEAHAEALGERLAHELLDGGARAILAAINVDREKRVEETQAAQ